MGTNTTNMGSGTEVLETIGSDLGDATDIADNSNIANFQ
jgi:hypothetical protein